MGYTNERAFNGILAAALDRRHPRWSAHAEQTSTLKGAAGRAPDIVLYWKGNTAAVPVVLETEYTPAATVDADAEARLGKILAGSGHTVEQAVAVSIPAGLAKVSAGRLSAAAQKAVYAYRHVRRTPDGDVWYPAQGRIHGTVDDLAGFCERIALNEHLLNKAAEDMRHTVGAAANQLRDRLTPNRAGALKEIARELRQQDSPQTTRMAVAVIANAFLFQSAIAGTVDKGWAVPSPSSDDTREEVSVVWKRILEINYWPVFGIARRLLKHVPHAEAKELIAGTQRGGSVRDVSAGLVGLASRLAGHGAVSTADMAGQMFGRLIADRKFLATFYTRPAAAHLLAEIAVARLSTGWGDSKQVTSLRAADLACGTGALLTAVYQRIAARVRRHGSDDAEAHPAMMEQALIGADIMPAAVHLTATLLSSAHPTSKFGRTGVHLMPYGETPDLSGGGSSFRVGSLEMLDGGYRQTSWLDKGAAAVHGDGNGKKNSPVAPVDHNKADIVIMNPPFTRPTSHETAAKAAVPVPSFAGFDTEKEEQTKMAARLRALNRNITGRAGHGNAGLASNFVDLAHAKAKPGGGVVALVLPFTAMTGGSWAPARRLLAEHYENICVMSIAAAGQTGRAFSADTGMAEVLLVADKRESAPSGTDDTGGGVDKAETPDAADGKNSGPSDSAGTPEDGENTDTAEGENTDSADDKPVLYVNLRERPATVVEGVETAHAITALNHRNQVSGPVKIGDAKIGVFIRARIEDGGCAGVSEADLAECSAALNRGRLRLPRLGGIAKAEALLTKLGYIGERGPVDRDVNGWQGAPRTSAPRGPFDVDALNGKNWNTATWPMLWAHNAKRETRLTVEPDSEGRVRPGMSAKANEIWATASRLHFTTHFQLNSQPLAACLTPEQCIGGRAWPAFKLDDRLCEKDGKRSEKAVVLWANTTLGLIGFWWIGTRQQQGRAIVSISKLPQLTVLNPAALTGDQLDTAADIFDKLKTRKLKPANEAYKDSVRQELDKKVLVDLLGLDKKKVMGPLATLRNQWCSEPSVHGGKATAP